MAKHGKTGTARIIKATKYSWKGLKATSIQEAVFSQGHMLAVVGLSLLLVGKR